MLIPSQGASSGIGAATAEYFASLKCSLILVARNVEKMESIHKRCVQAGLPESRILISITDVTDDNALKIMVEQAVKKFGKLDILNPVESYYCVSKAAVDQLTKCLALELAPFGIRVNSIK
uniref:Uncharacterized protein n=1 Tax=Romanomermis culicivorax TaxID=13658 RepID=A0A915IC06_ROMCU